MTVNSNPANFSHNHSDIDTPKPSTDQLTTEGALKGDRNFDPIADHFEKKVYGGLKGAIRLAVLARDLTQQVKRLSEKQQRPLRILDIGAGLAQLSLEFARLGHEVTINDISANMLDKAQHNWKQWQLHEDNDSRESSKAFERNAATNIQWLVGPYQQLDHQLSGKYDVILCHALLEWLAKPQDIMDFFDRWIAPQGVLSLCFYNPVSFDYRNLIMGNFNLLNNPNFQSDNKKSLTPNHPVSKEEVSEWLMQHHYEILAVSGLRVFHDYAPLNRGGHNNPEAVIDMELKYSQREPYKWLGRYLHYLATPNF